MFIQPALTSVETGIVNIDGMDFVETDIPSSDPRDEGKNLLVARTLLTQGQAAHAAVRLQALRQSLRPLQHGRIVMPIQSGAHADVVAWGHTGNPLAIRRDPSLWLSKENLSWDDGESSAVKMGFIGELFPEDIFLVNPDFKDHPATLSWFTSVALAAAKTEADARYLVRLMYNAEYKDLMSYVYGDMPEEEIRAMSALLVKGKERQTSLSVVGPNADKRTRRGITDAFGHMWNWLGDLYDPTQLIPEDAELIDITRMMSSASWFYPSEDASVVGRVDGDPNEKGLGDGVRFVAVRRSLG